jgi:hypothetical protein
MAVAAPPLGSHAVQWRMRRRIIILALLFCAAGMTYILIRDVDNELNRTAFTVFGYAALGIIGTYVFGATWHDVAVPPGWTQPPPQPMAEPSPVSPIPQAPGAPTQ